MTNVKKKYTKKNSGKIRLKHIFTMLLIITTLGIICGIQTKINAETIPPSITVTYTAGTGIGAPVTVIHEVKNKQTCGENDYTDGKIVLTKNNENGVNFTHTKKNVKIDGATYQYDMLLTGWKLTSVTQDGTQITTFEEPEHYNYTDRTNAKKDIGTIYAQEGFYIVPDNVTAITVEAVYGWAIYVKNPYNQMVYDNNYWFDTAASIASGRTGASESNFGTNTTTDVVASIKRAYELIYLAGESGTAYDVYDHLIVLCGDIDDVRPSVATIPSTTYADIIDGKIVYDINSYNLALYNSKTACNSYWGGNYNTQINASFIGDVSQENSYHIYQKCQTWGWEVYGSLRFDNVVYTVAKNVPTSSIKVTSTGIYFGKFNNMKCITTERFYTWNPNTSTVLNNGAIAIVGRGFISESRILGGNVTIYLSSSQLSTTKDLKEYKYILIGGNAYITNYYNGTTSENSAQYNTGVQNPPTLCVVGGYMKNTYLTGSSSTTSYIEFTRADNSIYMFMEGGVAENIYASGGTELRNGNVKINIQKATVKNIYGGGNKETGNINGDIYITINNSQIGFSDTNVGYIYGGPQYGNVFGNSYLEVTNTKVYGSIYGAGYGSNSTNEFWHKFILSISKNEIIEKLQKEIEEETSVYIIKNTADGYGFYIYNDDIKQFLNNSTVNLGFYEGDTAQIVTREYLGLDDSTSNVGKYFYYIVSSLSSASVENVYATIKNCDITKDVYAGGNKGSVKGNIEMNIEDTIVGGNIYGGSYSSSDTSINVYTKNFSFENLAYVYINSKGILVSHPRDNTNYYENGIKNGLLYESFKWSDEEYLLTNSETPKVINGIDYTNKKVYSANANKMGTIYGNVTLNVKDSKANQIYGGGYGGHTLGIVNINLENITNTSVIYGGGYNGNTGDTNTILTNCNIATYYNGGLNGSVGNSKLTINNSNISTVYNGGNKGNTNGNTTLIMNGGTIDTMYGGGNLANVNGSSTITINAGTITNTLYCGGNNGNVTGDCDLVITQGKLNTVFGGGNLGLVEGNTNVKVGDEKNSYIEITNILYGGGKGTSATFETVKGNSTVVIEGVNTKVANYGSSTLGKVVGNVDLTFKNYWTGNTTDKYRVMNGIDRATNVRFDNSYVLLENKAPDGSLEGIKDITNLFIPAGSGLKVSAPGEIAGNFNGGGIFCLDSGICLNVRGNITGDTTLVLNPKLIEGGMLIQGSKNTPYMRVYGEDLSETHALYSIDSRYTILEATESTGAKIFYTEPDVKINEKLENEILNAEGKHYTDDIATWTTEDCYVVDNASFSTNCNINMEFMDDSLAPEKYENITRKLALYTGETIAELPIGTNIVMVAEDGKLYQYRVTTSLPEIELSSFKEMENTINPYNEIQNVKEAATIVGGNELNKTYQFNETFRFILDFSESKPETRLPRGPYNLLLNYYDASKAMTELVSKAQNVIRIENIRNYDLTYETDREEYEQTSIINIDLNIKSNYHILWDTTIPRDLVAMISIKGVDGNVVELVENYNLYIDNSAVTHTNSNALYTVVDTLGKEAFEKQNKLKVDMSKLNSNELLKAGENKIVLDYYISNAGVLEEKVATYEIPIKIIKYNFCSLVSTVKSANGITGKDLLAINLSATAPEKTRTIEMSYIGDLIEPKVEIKLQRKNGENYINLANTVTTTLHSNLQSTQTITADFSSLTPGTYRLNFYLQDKYGTEKAQEALLFECK